MSGIRFIDWLGAVALPLALVATFLLFVPGLVRADCISSAGEGLEILRFFGSAES